MHDYKGHLAREPKKTGVKPGSSHNDYAEGSEVYEDPFVGR